MDAASRSEMHLRTDIHKGPHFDVGRQFGAWLDNSSGMDGVEIGHSRWRCLDAPEIALVVGGNADAVSRLDKERRLDNEASGCCDGLHGRA